MGFSNLTFGAWNAEQLKALVVFLVIAVPGLMALYAVMRISPDRWWLWMSGVFGGIMILIMWAWPIVIAPIFNTFTPLPDGELKARVLAMTEKGGVRVDKVLVVDASRQSKHTNAYFAGVGSSKRVVLFDTLVKDHTPEEVENVLAHEIGHWRKNHIWKGLVIALAGFVLFSSWPINYWARARRGDGGDGGEIRPCRTTLDLFAGDRRGIREPAVSKRGVAALRAGGG